MKYVLDTGVFRKLLDNYPKKGIYEKHWEQIDLGFKNKVLVSVDECYEELSKYYQEQQDSMEWLKSRKKYFEYPSNQESLFIKELFKNKKYQELIHRKNIVGNLPSADPFLIAKAKIEDAILVTIETYKPNSSKIPYICEKLGIQCLTYENFMEEFIK